MRCGLYGKLPAKRDFIAIAAPRAFLRLWEPWQEQGLAAAREGAPADAFKAAYAKAPIWRFWLGPALCGEAVAGAFMPSADALGRMFPLTLIGRASGAEQLAPPDLDPREGWFGRVEDLLLDALDPRLSFAALAARLAALDAGPTRAQAVPEEARGVFTALRAGAPSCPAGAATFWWTIGGEGCAPSAMMQRAMPAPAAFAAMLGGAREAGGEAGARAAAAQSDPWAGP